LSFVRHLDAAGWQVSVLTASERAHPVIRVESLSVVPKAVQVHRTTAFDASRHFAIRGFYPAFLTIPDRWQSWIVPSVLRAIRQHHKAPYDVMYVTYPIASALVIGEQVARRLKLPWVADFRDPITQEDFPKNPKVRQRFETIERRVIASANRVCLTTSASRDYYATKYCDQPDQRWELIGNGYDQTRLEPLVQRLPASRPSHRLTMLHSGLVYAKDRNPGMLFAALKRLVERGEVAANNFSLVFRGSGQDEMILNLAKEYSVSQLVTVAPSIPYDDAVREMVTADALLILQGAGVSRQVPAKIYEYLYVCRPILGITNHDGCTGQLLSDLGITGVAPLEEAGQIELTLQRALREIRDGTYRVPARDEVIHFSREAGAARLARILESVIAEGSRFGSR
jgi:glycosyltransferase involved in cell wall biosynthesis